MMDAYPPRKVFLIIASVALLAGCARSHSARFYTLSPIDRQEAKPSVRQHVSTIAVRVMPVQIPDYLDRPQIVTRTGQNALKRAEFDRWAGSLSGGITSVLAENLGWLLGSDHVFADPEKGEKPDFSVSMQVLRLDLQPGEKVLLKVRWAVSRAQKGANPVTRVSSYTEKVSNNSGYETLVEGVTHTLEQVSREIGEEIASQATLSAAPARPQELE